MSVQCVLYVKNHRSVSRQSPVNMVEYASMSTWTPPIGLDAFLAQATRPLIVVLGPTASGKTAYSVRLAQYLGRTEIINADSRQLYRGMDIGTAKITPQETGGVSHHLFDVLTPDQPVTVAWYKEQAQAAIADIHTRAHTPMLVGGSMLYISAIIDGLDLATPADPQLRQALTAIYDADQGLTLHRELTHLDPVSAAKIPRQNKPYVIRAIEKFRSGGDGGTTPCPYDLFILGLYVPVETLNAGITARSASLVRGGWIGEVERLITAGYGPASPGFQSHGYREVLAWLEQGDPDDTALIADIAAKTRQYAKRQRTWWRQDPRIRWVTPSGLPAPGYAAAAQV